MKRDAWSFGAFAALAFLCGCASGGGDRRAVLDATESFFRAMEERDVALGSRVVVPEGVFVSVREGEEGEREVRTMSNGEWLAGLADRESAVRETFTGRPHVLVEGDVAMVWGEYAFEVGGARRHTGMDVFTLVRTDEGWKIAGGAYSVEPVE